jgi:hypothetical protein
MTREVHALRQHKPAKIKKILLAHALVHRESDAPPNESRRGKRRQSESG